MGKAPKIDEPKIDSEDHGGEDQPHHDNRKLGFAHRHRIEDEACHNIGKRGHGLVNSLIETHLARHSHRPLRLC